MSGNLFTEHLSSIDPEVDGLLGEELKRQREGIELIASENFTSSAVLECLGSIATNKYSEGQVGKRYYGGNEIIDKLEKLAQERALAAFGLNPEVWGVNVQPYSGSVANAAVYLGLLKPGETLMGLDLPSGGHLTHGYRTETKAISSSAEYYNSKPYKIGSDGKINYDEMAALVAEHKPRLIICGASAYPYDFEYERFRAAADSCGAYLMADIAHIAGFVAKGLMRSPFDFCDVVTTTTHKTLRGPRAGMIFYRRELQTKIEMAVFPGLQGGPHENQIAAIATQMREVASPEYRTYMEQVHENCQILIGWLRHYDFTVTDSQNHLCLVDVSKIGLTGAMAECALELIGISVNKNMIYGDKSALNPSGIRIGTPAITSRGMTFKDMGRVALLIYNCLLRAAHIIEKIRSDTGNQLVSRSIFVDAFKNDYDLNQLKFDVIHFMQRFPFYSTITGTGAEPKA